MNFSLNRLFSIRLCISKAQWNFHTSMYEISPVLTLQKKRRKQIQRNLYKLPRRTSLLRSQSRSTRLPPQQRMGNLKKKRTIGLKMIIRRMKPKRISISKLKWPLRVFSIFIALHFALPRMKTLSDFLCALPLGLHLPLGSFSTLHLLYHPHAADIPEPNHSFSPSKTLVQKPREASVSNKPRLSTIHSCLMAIRRTVQLQSLLFPRDRGQLSSRRE